MQPPPLIKPSYEPVNVERSQTVRGARPGTIRQRGTAVDYRMSTMGGPGPTRALTRGKTLTRPERFVAPAPLINPAKQTGGGYRTTLVNGIPTLEETSSFDWWTITVYVLTPWAPGFILSKFGKKDPDIQRAFREKCALCTIILLLMTIVGFLTIGLTRVLCPDDHITNFLRAGQIPSLVGIGGIAYNTTENTPRDLIDLSTSFSGSDISNQFNRPQVASCQGSTAAYASTNLCSQRTGNRLSTTCQRATLSAQLLGQLGLVSTGKLVGYDWHQVANMTNAFVLNGIVLDMTPYMAAHPTPTRNDTVDTAIRYMLQSADPSAGKDATKIWMSNPELKDSANCIQQRYIAGNIDKISAGCFVSQLFLYVSLTLILSIVFARFFMAIIFKWYLSERLIRPPKNLRNKAISPGVMPEGANLDMDNTTGVAPWLSTKQPATKLKKSKSQNAPAVNGAAALGKENDGMISLATIGAELFCVCLVTCYSEGEEGIRTTLDSIAGSDYSDARKLIFVVCDGMITGGGESKSTPDICVGLLERDERFGEPGAMSYGAVADGAKAHNQAMVYAGHYTNVVGHRTPMVVVVKCGPPSEATAPKPGNRGKRDSQMILMNFFSRVTFNDLMCPLDFDLFRKIHVLMGVTPDFFEVCLMVDADTLIFPDSLGYLVRVMQNDNMVMGCCGETRIANKRQSWVTAIQVFEYFISHHQAKAFEACFGGVTCLPGCFSIYRLKARKANNSDWFPVLVQPQICSQYSQSVVTTLHQKNLLLLGEDRFLTTLLIRTFPNRKMLFCPQARCRTIAPDTFSVLLSQRRRWINSTVHNLFELVLVPNLCGTFCFSMQFVVFIDLIGTLVLPIAICLTFTLLINYIFFNPPRQFSDAIPLLLLFAVLGLPAFLILLTTMKVVYVGWMFVYLLALPVWNFVLPAYAYTKFDDFSWGATRVVEGETKATAGHHGSTPGEVSAADQVPMRRWEDWERSRVRKIRRDEKRRREFERQFGRAYHGDPNANPNANLGPLGPMSSNDDTMTMDHSSDSASMMSGSEDGDWWGHQIGAYSEDQPTAIPPPVGLYVDGGTYNDRWDADSTIHASELEAVLEHGWNDRPRGSNSSGGHGPRPGPGGYMQVNPSGSATQPPPKMYSLADTSYTTDFGSNTFGSSVGFAGSHGGPSTPGSAGVANSTGVEAYGGHIKRRSFGK